MLIYGERKNGKVIFRIEESLLKAYQELCEKRGVSVAEGIRRLIYDEVMKPENNTKTEQDGNKNRQAV